MTGTRDGICYFELQLIQEYVSLPPLIFLLEFQDRDLKRKPLSNPTYGFSLSLVSLFSHHAQMRLFKHIS